MGFSHGKQYFKQTFEYTKRHGLEKYIIYPQPYENMPIFINSSDLVYSAVVKKILNFATPLGHRQGVHTYRNYEELKRIQSDINGKVWLG